MDEARLRPDIEASSFLRQAEQMGGFGAVLHRGDEQRGTLLIAVRERGVPITCLVRSLTIDGRYRWTRVGPDGENGEFLAKRRRGDPDEWQIELDIPSAERFIAETTATG